MRTCREPVGAANERMTPRRLTCRGASGSIRALFMKHIYRFVALVGVMWVAGCGEKEGEVTKPSQGPAAVGPAPITTANATVAPTASAKAVEPAKPAASSAPAAAPRKWSLFGGDSKPAPAAPAPSATTTAKVPEKPAGPKPVAPLPPPAKTSAKVVMVKAESEYRFVVIEFSTSDIPSAGSLLTLYRGKDRVASVKVTEPVRPPHVTADIVDGQPRVGDEVR